MGLDPISAIAASTAPVTAYLGYRGAEDERRAQENMFGMSMDWMQRMSGTAHQREVADLVKAGLNPLLSVGGGGASTPSMSAPTPTKSPISAAMSSAMEGARLATSVAQSSADLKNTDADTIKKAAEARQAAAQTEQSIASAKRINAETENVRADEPYRKASGRFWDMLNSITDKLAPSTSPNSAKDVWKPAGVKYFKNLMLPDSVMDKGVETMQDIQNSKP